MTVGAKPEKNVDKLRKLCLTSTETVNSNDVILTVVSRAALPHVSHFGKATRMMDAGEPALVSPAIMSAFSSAPTYSHFGLPAATSPSALPVGHGQRRVEIVLDVNSVMKTSPRKILKAFFADPDSNDAVSIGYVTTSSVW